MLDAGPVAVWFAAIQWFPSQIVDGVTALARHKPSDLSSHRPKEPPSDTFDEVPNGVLSNSPCSACSWSAERQLRTLYKSNVNIFDSASDRGVWSVWSRMILKERSNAAPNFDARNSPFLGSLTSIPLPVIHNEWEDNGRYFMLLERIQDEILEEAWPNLTAEDKSRIAQQVADYIGQLRKLQSPKMCGIDGGPLFSDFLFLAGFENPHGPFTSTHEIRTDMEQAMTPHVPGNPRNVYWTVCPMLNLSLSRTAISLTSTAWSRTELGWHYRLGEWKDLLRNHMVRHEGASKVWHEFYILSHVEKLETEEGKEILRQLLSD
ncbi:hypothetical protein ANO11243_066410 [Dothideomycetidae sp. 11243]|nr:hypothetical protein ANO11243_066410 [fungal sp. No.11243]